MVLAGLLLAGVAYGFSRAQPNLYRASVVLLARPNRADYSLDLFLKSRLNSFKAVLTSRQLAEEVIRRTQVDLSPLEVAGRIKVISNPEESTITVTVDDSLPQQAQAIADALADVFVEKVQVENMGLPPSDLKVDIQKVDSPIVPDRPITPNTTANTLAGLVLGLTLGAVAIAIWGMLDRTLRGLEDVERIVGLRVLATIPPYREDRTRQVLRAEPAKATGRVEPLG
jgi:non-specific protein-tyrosine kinase